MSVSCVRLPPVFLNRLQKTPGGAGSQVKSSQVNSSSVAGTRGTHLRRVRGGFLYKLGVVSYTSSAGPVNARAFISPTAFEQGSRRGEALWEREGQGGDVQFPIVFGYSFLSDTYLDVS